MGVYSRLLVVPTPRRRHTTWSANNVVPYIRHAITITFRFILTNTVEILVKWLVIATAPVHKGHNYALGVLSLDALDLGGKHVLFVVSKQKKGGNLFRDVQRRRKARFRRQIFLVC